MLDHNDYVNEFYNNRVGDTERVSDEILTMYLDDSLVKLIADKFNDPTIDAKHEIGDAVSKFIESRLKDDAEDYARDQMFNNRIRPML